MQEQWQTERRLDMRRSLHEVQCLCPGMFDDVHRNTPYRWKRSAPRAETHCGRKSMLTPADTTRLSEHIMRITDVLCLNAATLQRLVHEWLDEMGFDVRTWSRVGQRAPAWHALELQEARQLLEGSPQPCCCKHANTHRLFVKLCWLMDTARCRRRPRREHRRNLVPPPPGAPDGVGPQRGQASPAAGQHKGGHDIHGRLSAWTVARWTCWCRSYTPARQPPSCPRSPGQRAPATSSQKTAGQRRPRSCSSWPLSTTCSTRGWEGQPWILLWDMASIHASEATLAAMRATFPHVVLCFLPPQSTSYLQPCDVAVFRSFKSCIQGQASATLARSVLDGSFHEIGHEQAMAAPVLGRMNGQLAQSADILCDANKVWSTGWRRLRADGDDPLQRSRRGGRGAPRRRRALRETHRPRARSRRPSGLGHGRADSDGEDDAPMPDAPPEPEIIDMPPDKPSAPRMTNLERCIALRFVYGARTTMSLARKNMSHMTVVTCVLFRCLRSLCPAQASLLWWKKKGVFLGFLVKWEGRWPQMMSTRGDFCAHARVHGGQPIVISRVFFACRKATA